MPYHSPARRLADTKRAVAVTSRAVAGLMLFVAVGVLFALPACQPPAPPAPSSSSTSSGERAASKPVDERLPRVGEVTREPVMRVRVKVGVGKSVLSHGGAVYLSPMQPNGSPATSKDRAVQPPVTITHDGQRFLIRDGAGQTLGWRVGSLHVRTAYGSRMSLDDVAYPGDLVFVAMANRNGEPTGRFDAINHVPMETYLPGVIEHELFGSWHLEAFKAQAIAARSYALFERRLNADRHYDLQATVASQVYGGAASNPRAIEAVRQTRGQVLAHDSTIVPGFYSSTCGGLTQTAGSAFPRFARLLAMRPLRGGVACTYCRPSPNYRWGPIERDANALADRIAAWGRANRDPVADLTGLRDIRLSHRSPAGRPARYELIDQRGRRYTLPAESFRFACNHAHPRHADLPRHEQLRSSHVRVRVQQGSVHFDDGRGHGHGAGMCQWGAQGMAAAGHTARDIVRHYYLNADIHRAY